jgi:hypothetical protein
MTRRYYNDFTLLRKLPQQIGCSRSGSAWAVCDGVLKEFTGSVARLVPGRGLLIEPAATNLIPYSRQIDVGNGWTLNNSTASTVVGLDGVSGSGSELEIDIPGTGSFERTITGAYANYVFSLYIKVPDSNTDPVYIALNSERVECFGVTSDWQRFIITAKVPNPRVQVIFSGTVIVDCLQLETGQVPTSPIPTTSGSVTRNKDDVYILWYASGVTPFTPTKGTFVFNVAMDKLTSSDQVLMKLYDHLTATNPYLRIAANRTDITRYNIGYNTPYEYTTSPTDEQAFQYDLNIRVATSFIDNQQSVAINGLLPLEVTQTESIDFTDIKIISLGSDEFSDHMCGYITELTFFDEYMQPADLARLSNALVGDIAVVDISTDDDESEYAEVISTLYRDRNKLSMHAFIASRDNSDTKDEDVKEQVEILNSMNMTNNLN